MNRQARMSWVILFVWLITVAGSAGALAEATVETDKEQYSVGETVFITGTGWQAGETVSLTIVSDSIGTVRAALSAIADGAGAIANSELVLGDQDADTGFLIQAQGQTSGLTAETFFMDGYYVVSVSISPQSPDPLLPGQSATYTVTVYYMRWWWCVSKPVTWTLQWAEPTPGASCSFSPNPLSPPAYSCSASSVLTISTTGAIAGGAHSFYVRACYGSSDCAGNSGQLNIVPDTTPPVPNVDPLPTVTGECSACAPTPTATDDRDGIVYGVPRGGPCFHDFGLHYIEWVYTDAAGNSSCQDQKVIVTDTHPPDIFCPSDIVVNAEPGKCSAKVTFSAYAHDNCGGFIHYYYSPSPGSDFHVGTTTVTCRAEDRGGNYSSCQFTVTVKDVEPPRMNIYGPLIVQAAPGTCSAIVHYNNVNAYDYCSSTTLTFSPPQDSELPVGTTQVTVTATDGYGNSVTGHFSVVVKDVDPPAISCPEDIVAQTDPNTCGAIISFPVSATDLCSEATVTASPPSGSLFPVGTTTVTCTATDASGNQSTCQFQVTVNDVAPPVITCPQDIVKITDSGACEAVIHFSPQFIDNCSIVETTIDPQPGSAFPIGTTTVHCAAWDASGNSATDSFKVTVYNPAPVVRITGPPSGSLYAVGAPISLEGTLKDNKGDTHVAEWLCGDMIIEGVIDGSTGIVTASCAFDSAGVYHILLRGIDQCGGTGTASTVDGLEAIVVVYDPDAGFVTGGGWIDSPPGAYRPDETLTGKANFGFVSKYQKGSSTPTGQTEFLFKIADLNFHSTSYNWLVVAGTKAMYKGSGAVNGEGDYGFMLSAIDGDLSNGDGVDKFRIKIVYKASGRTLYDNQMDADESADPVTALGGGSIIIHKQGDDQVDGQPGADETKPDGAGPLAFKLLQNWPNPFNPATNVPIELPRACGVRLSIYDVSGRLVRELVDASMPAGVHTIVWDGLDSSGNAVASGVYFYCIEAGRFRATRRMVLLR